MTRRGSKTTTHVHRVHTHGHPSGDGAKGKDLWLHHRHRLFRRSTTGFMLARKYRYMTSKLYASSTSVSASFTTTSFTQVPSSMWLPNVRNPWPPESELKPPAGNANSTSHHNHNGNPQNAINGAGDLSLIGATKGYTREELINFWKELPLVAKRRLLRIRREVYLTALDQFLVRQNLCCECHDNVIAEWEDHERKRSGSRSLQDVFTVFPPFLDDDDDDDDEDEDDDDGEDDEDDEEDLNGEIGDESDEEMLDTGDVMIDDAEEVVFKYELEREERRRSGRANMLSDEYLAALEVGKRQEDELLRLIQKEERYIIIREDHTDFIMDLIRCGEQFSYVSPFRGGIDDDDSDAYDDDDDGNECPGANTSHLAQEYLLEVLAIKFREQLEDAYQEALQHSLAIQAELLRDELADLKASQKPTTSKKKKNKDKKKRKKKDASVNASAKERTSMTSAPTPQKAQSKQGSSDPARNSPAKESTANRKESKASSTKQNQVPVSFLELSDSEYGDPEQEELDREVEEFRLLLEKINSESTMRTKKKLVLPPGAFANVSASMAVCQSL